MDEGRMIGPIEQSADQPVAGVADDQELAIETVEVAQPHRPPAEGKDLRHDVGRDPSVAKRSQPRPKRLARPVAIRFEQRDGAPRKRVPDLVEKRRGSALPKTEDDDLHARSRYIVA